MQLHPFCFFITVQLQKVVGEVCQLGALAFFKRDERVQLVVL